MTQIIDRRLNGKNKSAVNRQRFIRRYKSQIKKAVGEAIGGRSITDIERGKPLELEWLSGAVHRLGHEAGVPTPIHSTAYAVLRPLAGGSSA